MKRVTALLALLVVAAPLRAGIYTTIDGGDMFLSRNIEKFRTETLSNVRGIALDDLKPDVALYFSPLRKRYVLMDALGGARPPSSLTLEEKLNYSAVLIRRKKYQEAIDFLTPLTRQHPEIFLFDSHLAMANWLSGQPQRAVDLQDTMLKTNWPERFDQVEGNAAEFLKNSMGWNEGPFTTYRNNEIALLRLMKNRLGENRTAPYKTIDPLFGDPKDPLRYIGPSGKYEPGVLDAKEKRKIPENAIETVEQLLIWLPDDNRLLWQLGELANARGNPPAIRAAQKILDTLVFDSNVPAEELKEHRRILNDFKSPDEDPSEPTEGPRGGVIVLPPDTPAPLPTRTIAVIFATGFAAGVFAIWQYQELRRRRRREPAPD